MVTLTATQLRHDLYHMSRNLATTMEDIDQEDLFIHHVRYKMLLGLGTIAHKFVVFKSTILMFKMQH